MSARLSALALFVALSPAAAMAQGTDALDFFAGQGCAVGPATVAAAEQAGLAKADINALTQKAAAHPDTIQTGGWLVMPPDMCRMRLPDIESEISLTDPEVVASISAIDAHASEDSPGCFLDADGLMERLQAERGWSKERAFDAYLQLMAGSLASGEATFFSTDPLMTPWGIQIVTGDCGTGLPEIDQIREDHAYLVTNFDSIIRASAIGTECVDGAVGTFFLSEQPDATQNAWTAFQAFLIIQGAGWYQGASLTEKGVPRPPLCRYPAAD